MTTRLAFIVFGVALALRVVHSCIFLAIRTWSSPATNTHRLLLYLLFHISFPRDHTKSSEERQQREGELPHRRHTLCANSYRDRIDYAPHARDHWIFSIKDISFGCASRRHTISVIVCLCRNVSLSTRSFLAKWRMKRRRDVAQHQLLLDSAAVWSFSRMPLPWQ